MICPPTKYSGLLTQLGTTFGTFDDIGCFLETIGISNQATNTAKYAARHIYIEGGYYG